MSHDKLVKTYLIELKNNKYFVGKTCQLDELIRRYEKGDYGRKWIRMHGFKRFVMYRAGDHEEAMTLQYMSKYGWQNVRGYAWSQVDMDKPPLALRDSD